MLPLGIHRSLGLEDGLATEGGALGPRQERSGSNKVKPRPPPGWPQLREKPEKDGSSFFLRAWLSLGMGGALDLCTSLPCSPHMSSGPSQPPLCSEAQRPHWLGWECICRSSLGTEGTQGGDPRRGSRIPSISLVSALLLYIVGSPPLACHSRAHQRLSIFTKSSPVNC